MTAPEAPDERYRIALAPYDAEWPQIYRAIADELLAACGPQIVEVHHIGSTSVPGLPAKPVIDVMPGLRSYEDGFAVVEAMEALGYEYCGEYGIPRRHYFRMTAGPGLRRHIHVYAVGDGQWHWHLAFRDHLRTHHDDRERYSQLKMQLAARFPYDMEAYAAAKSDFVRAILRQYLDVDEAFAAR